MAGQSQRQADPNDPFADEDQDGEGSNDEARDQRAAPNGADGGESNDSDDEVKRLRERLRKQSSVAKSLADRVRELEPKARDSQSVEERAAAAERERDAIRRELQEERATRTIMAAASRAGAVDPEDVADLMLRRNLIDFDDEGRPQDVREIIEELQRNKPHLFTPARRVPDADAGRGNGRRAGEGEQKPDWNAAFRRKATTTGR